KRTVNVDLVVEPLACRPSQCLRTRFSLLYQRVRRIREDAPRHTIGDLLFECSVPRIESVLGCLDEIFLSFTVSGSRRGEN
ncbi:hypothetical protein PFISCL1PPCAC_28075, partial [Pristionchus fissidentatus]